MKYIDNGAGDQRGVDFHLLFLGGVLWAVLLNSCKPDLRNLNRIDLSGGGMEPIIVLDAPDRIEKSSSLEIILPAFTHYCHLAADSNMFRWIGASNRMFPWVGTTNLTSIFVAKNPLPPAICH